MEVSNITLVAYIDTFKEYQLDPKGLVDGTSLKYEELLNTKEKIRWSDFEQITNNTFRLIGEERTLNSLRKTGVNNEALSVVKKITSATFRIEDTYWFFCSFIGKYFYKNLQFNYKKICKGHIQITILMNDGSICFDNFVKAYASAFEGFPTGIGLRPATAIIDNTENNPIINIYYRDSIKIWNPISLAKRFFRSLQNTSHLLNEIEEKTDEQVRLNQKLDSSNQLNETLIKAIMHDLSNPLTIIRLKNEKFNRRPESFTEKDKELLSRSINNMHNVIEDLKKYFVQRNASSSDTFNLLEAIDHVAEMFNDTLAEKNITLKISSDISPNTMLAGSGPTFVNSILANILSNAIKFSFEGSTISIKTKNHLGRVLISIKDNGVGLRKDIIESFHNNRTCSSESGTLGEVGLGVGLTQVNYFVKEMDGDVLIDSKLQNEFPDDHGTEFKFFFNTKKQEVLLH